MNSPLLEGPWKIRETCNWKGVRLGWEVKTYLEDYETALNQGGIFDLSDCGLVEVRGVDAKDFLQRMSTANLKAWDKDSACHAAFLNGKGQVISMGILYGEGDSFSFVTPPGQSSLVADHLEKFHFSERLAITDVSDQVVQLGIYRSQKLFELLGIEPLGMKRFERRWGGVEFRGFFDDAWGDMAWVALEKKDLKGVLVQWSGEAVSLLGRHVYEYLRIQKGIPSSSVEVGASDIILESNFDRAVARNKGCYPGQEVVERIFTYGSVNRKLLRVKLEASDVLPPLPFMFSLKDNVQGQVVSCAQNPRNSKEWVGLAFIPRVAWDWTDSWKTQTGIMIQIVR